KARHKCGPGWERFTTRLDVAKLNMMLSSGSLETGTGSSNSLRSANESFSVCNSARDDRNTRLRGRFRTARGSGERLENRADNAKSGIRGLFTDLLYSVGIRPHSESRRRLDEAPLLIATCSGLTLGRLDRVRTIATRS